MILAELKTSKQKLVGARVYLRALDANDATERYVSWLSDPKVNRFLATKRSTVVEQRQYITAKNGKDDCILLGIFLPEDDRMVGTVKLEYIDTAKGTADIAIMLGDRSVAGQGLGGEAMRILIDYAFGELGLREITLGVIAQHTGAVRAYEKLGFTETGRKHGAVTYNGETFDHLTMRLQKNQ